MLHFSVHLENNICSSLIEAYCNILNHRIIKLFITVAAVRTFFSDLYCLKHTFCMVTWYCSAPYYGRSSVDLTYRSVITTGWDSQENSQWHR